MGTKRLTAPALALALQHNGVQPDTVGRIKTGEYAGCFRVRRSFFYRNGKSAVQWAARVQSALKGVNAEVVGNQEDWVAWPSTSYFTAFVRTIPRCNTCKKRGGFMGHECSSCRDTRIQFDEDEQREAQRILDEETV